MKILITILALVAVSQGFEIFDRPCRTPNDLGVKTDFQSAQYLGIWYEIERYEQFFQLGSDCTQAQYTLNDDQSIRVFNSAFVIANNTRISDTGVGRISFPDEVPLRAMLNVTFNENQPSVSNYWVLRTDYTNYAVVVSCFDIPNNQSSESYWLLSRQFQINAAGRASADEIIEKFLDKSRIRTTNQDNATCGRLPNRNISLN